MKPAPHVPLCGEMSAEQQAVVDRYLERQAARPDAKCPVAKRDDGYNSVLIKHLTLVSTIKRATCH